MNLSESTEFCCASDVSETQPLTASAISPKPPLNTSPSVSPTEHLFEVDGIKLNEKSIIEELMKIAFADTFEDSADKKKSPPKISEKMKALEILGNCIGIFKNTHEEKIPELTIVYDYGVSEEK